MVDRSLALRRVGELQRRLGRLRELLPEDRAVYLAEEGIQEGVSWNLVLAIQSLVDLGAMILSDAGWGVPETVSGTFTKLAEHGVLDPELAGRLRLAVRLRNLLVHRYGDVDHGRVFEALARDLGDLDAAAAGLVAYVEASEE